jgi:hypothetical protein
MVLNKMRLIQLIQAGQTLVGVTEVGLTYRWDEAAGRWIEILQSSDEEEMQRRIALAVIPAVPPELRPLGPVYDRSGDRLISASRSMRTGQLRLNVGRRDQDWKAERGAAASMGTQLLLCEPDGGILLVSSLGLYRLSGDPAWKAEPLQLFGLSIPLPSGGPFLSVGPDPAVLLVRPSAAASNGTITLLNKTDEGFYERRLERKWDSQNGADVVLAFGGDTLLVGHESGRISVYDAEDLQPRGEFTVEGKNQPRFAAAAPGGRHFAVVFHHGRLWLYDHTANQLTRPRVAGQKDISCVSFPAADRLLVADCATRVTQYRIPDCGVEARYSPPLSLVERIHRYGLAPVYTVFPKPRELDKTVEYVLSGKQTGDLGGGGGDLGTAQRNLHPWRPVWSSLAFVAVMLLAGCVYLHRQDF